MADVCQDILREFQLSEDARICRGCRQKILGFTKEIEQRCQTQPKLTPTESFTTALTTCAMVGEARVKYTNTSGATKREKLSSAKYLVSEVVEKCETISNENGLELFKDVTNSGPVRGRTKSIEDCEDKVNKVIDRVSHGSNNWTIKQLHKAILKEIQILQAGEETSFRPSK